MAKHKWDLKIPASDDLRGWKEADLRLIGRFADFLQYESRLWSPRAAKRYFNDDNLEYFFRKHKCFKHLKANACAPIILDFKNTEY